MIESVGRHEYRIDGMHVQYRINELMARSTIFVFEQTGPRQRYIVVAAKQPSLDQTLYALSQFIIQKHRLPLTELRRLQEFYMKYGTLPAEYPMP